MVMIAFLLPIFQHFVCSSLNYRKCSSLNFLVLGDTGDEFSKLLPEAAEVYSLAIKDNPSCSITVLLGDNFYECGLARESDASSGRFNYIHSIFPSSRVYGVLGNHDYFGDFKGCVGGNAEEQILYSREKQWPLLKGHSEWVMKDHNFSEVIEISNGRKILLIFIDTNDTAKYPSAYQEWKIEYTLEYLRTLFKHYEHLKFYKIFVFGHHPILSSGPNFVHYDFKTSDTLYRDILPLLMDFGVNAYFAGHDHISQHILIDDARSQSIDSFFSIEKKLEDHKLQMFLSGNAVKQYGLESTVVEAESFIQDRLGKKYIGMYHSADKFTRAKYNGFMHMSVDADGYSVDVYDTAAKSVIYSWRE